MVDEHFIKFEVCRAMRLLYERGLVTSLSGNVSAKVPGTKTFWITPSGVFKGGISPNDLVKLDFELNILEGTKKPSIEAKTHALIYKARPDINAVVHAHNPITVSLVNLGYNLEFLSSEAELIIKKIKVIPYALPGSEELTKYVYNSVKEKNVKALILIKHGVIGLGSSLLEAISVVESLEDLAKMNLIKLLLKKLNL